MTVYDHDLCVGTGLETCRTSEITTREREREREILDWREMDRLADRQTKTLSDRQMHGDSG